MRNTLLTCIDRFRHDRHERLVLGSVLLILAVIVSLTVYWQLRYIGITMTNETFCGYEEHVHAEECYDEEGSLICGLEEHTHTVDCLINLNADVEDSDAWRATLPVLTQNLKTDIINIAYSQLGYTESTANYSIGDDGETHYGYTRYGAWYGNEYGTWDAMFVSFCLNYAGVDRTVFPFGSGAYSWATSLAELGYYSEASGCTPASGDLIFFDTDSDGRIDHVGIVVAVDETSATVTVIEGDYSSGESDTVALNTYYYLTDTTISGYGILPISEETEEIASEEADEETEEADEEEVVVANDITYTASDSGVTVTVIAPEGALPDGAILSVSLLDEESEEYASAAEAVGYEDSEDTGMAALDITFYDESGFEVEPTAAVTVSVDITEIIPSGTTADTIEVTHITDTEVNTVETLIETVTDTTDETAVVVFETESFSTFTLQWTMSQGPNTKTVSITATTYLSGTSDTIGTGNTTLTGTLNTAYDLTSSNTSLAIDGYTLVSATVTYNGTVYDATAITINITDNRGNTTYTYYYTNSNGNRVQLYSGNREQTVTIQLYYEKDSASITINKYETGTSTLLSGAEFELESTAVIEDVISADGVTLTFTDNYTATFTTNGSGITLSDLPDGNYTLTETLAPTGYDVASGSIKFYVESNSISNTESTNSTHYIYNSSSGEINVYDDPSTVELTLEKVYTDASGIEISTSDSSVFTLTRTSATSYSSESDQTVTFSGAGTDTLTCRYGSTYTLSETTAPSGYEDVGDITISVDSSGNITVSGNASLSGTTVTITNKALTEVIVSKTYYNADGSTMSNTSDEATFTVYDENNNTVGTVTITGAGTGTISLSAGTYTISETTVPDGYTASDAVTFTIEDGVVKVNNAAVGGNTVSFTNTAKTTLTIKKMYATSSGTTMSTGIDELTATFTLTDGTVTYTSTITGTDTDTFYISDGTYTLSETAPSGYEAISDVTVTVSNGEISISTVDNVSISGDTITVINVPDDDHKYAGYSYAIVNFNTDSNNNVKQSSLSSTSYGTNQGLAGVVVDSYYTDSDGNTYVTGENITLWTFIPASGSDTYYITDGNGNYLNIYGSNSNGVSVSDEPVAITVTDGTGTLAGKVMLSTSSMSNVLNNYSATRFDGWNSTTNYEDGNNWQTLCLIEDSLYITDDLISSGNYIATMIVDGVVVDLTDPKYTVTWYKAEYAFDSSYNCYVNGSYTEVTNSDALGDNNSTVNVAIDQGGLYYYYVTVSYVDDAGNTVTLESTVEHVPYAAELLNCSFEWNSSGTQDQSYIPFWNTTASTDNIEIGEYSSSSKVYGTNTSEDGGAETGIYAGGSQDAAGDQFAELNADTESTLYQSVLTVGGEELNWSFYHRARTNSGWGSYYNATDTMYIVLMSEEDAQKVFEYADASGTAQQTILTNMINNMTVTGTTNNTNATAYKEGTYTFTLNNESVTVDLAVWTLTTYNEIYGDWTRYYGTYEVPDEQYVTRFFFVSGETQYTGSNTVGNLIDYATFSQNVQYVIEYWTISSDGVTYELAYTETSSAYPYTLVSAQYLSDFSDYGLVGSVTGTASGGSSPTFDTYTTTSMRVTSDTMYLSLYLKTPVVAVVKVLEGLDDVLTTMDAQTITFEITPNQNSVGDTVEITVGDTGTGSGYTEVLAAGSYTISESGYSETITVDGVDYYWTGVTVTVSDPDANLTNNGDGTYSFTLKDDSSLTITFTNTYAEAVTYSGLEMPQTGGRGTKLYTMVGILLICSGGYLLYRLKLQRQLKQQKRKCRWRWNI